MRRNPMAVIEIDSASLGSRLLASEIRELQDRNRLFGELWRHFEHHEREMAVTTLGQSSSAAASSFSSSSSLAAEIGARDWIRHFLPLLTARSEEEPSKQDLVGLTGLYWVIRSRPDGLRDVAALLVRHQRRHREDLSLDDSPDASVAARHGLCLPRGRSHSTRHPSPSHHRHRRGGPGRRRRRLLLVPRFLGSLSFPRARAEGDRRRRGTAVPISLSPASDHSEKYGCRLRRLLRLLLLADPRSHQGESPRADASGLSSSSSNHFFAPSSFSLGISNCLTFRPEGGNDTDHSNEKGRGRRKAVTSKLIT
jgi:hypothetical protein